MNSRNKGKRGELEFVHYLKDKGIEARRGQQYAGGGDSPDVMAGGIFKNYHFEVKRREAGNPYHWIEQAEHDAAGCNIPVVAHKRNGKKWLAIIDMDLLVNLVREVHAQYIK